MSEWSENTYTAPQPPETWAVAELMGHLTLAGRLTKPGDNGGLWQIDIPDETPAGFHTEFFASGSVYRIRIVSEQIARAYVRKNEIIEYAAPIVTQEEHQAALNRAREIIEGLRSELRQVKALPPGYEHLEDDDDDDYRDESAPYLVEVDGDDDEF